MLAFVSPKGVITRYSLEVEFDPADLRMALVEAGEGTVGYAVDQLILWCFSFDPTSNSYIPLAWKIMRSPGAATVRFILACLAPFWLGRNGAPQPVIDPFDADPIRSKAGSRVGTYHIGNRNISDPTIEMMLSNLTRRFSF